MATAFVVVALHMPGHLAGPVPWRFEELLINDLHKPQVLSALVFRLIIQVGSGQGQQLALTTQTQLVVLAQDFLPRVPSSCCEASAKKSRSTTSWPILECSLSTSAMLT